MRTTTEHQVNLANLREEMMERCYQIQMEYEQQSNSFMPSSNPSYLQPINTIGNKQNNLSKMEER